MTPEQLEYQQALVKQIQLQEELILALKQKIVGLEEEIKQIKDANLASYMRRNG